MITVVDYGMGNLRNVRRAFGELGHAAEVTADLSRIRSAHKVVLPGVGAFGEAVRRIDSLGLRDVLRGHAAAGVPILGICLGMQLLYERSDESPGATGLGVLAGSVRKFGGVLKVPHIGWNDVVPAPGAPLFPPIGQPLCCYFVHSYFVAVDRSTTATTTYGIPYASALARGSVFGFQFHPEKSQEAGLKLLDAFAVL